VDALVQVAGQKHWWNPAPLKSGRALICYWFQSLNTSHRFWNMFTYSCRKGLLHQSVNDMKPRVSNIHCSWQRKFNLFLLYIRLLFFAVAWCQACPGIRIQLPINGRNWKVIPSLNENMGQDVFHLRDFVTHRVTEWHSCKYPFSFKKGPMSLWSCLA
jgi:hypothetical protein